MGFVIEKVTSKTKKNKRQQTSMTNPSPPIPGELRKYRGTWDNSIVRMFQIVYDDKKSPTPEIIYFMAHTQDEAQTWIKKIKENIAYVRNAEPLSHAGSSFVSNKSGSAKVHF